MFEKLIKTDKLLGCVVLGLIALFVIGGIIIGAIVEGGIALLIGLLAAVVLFIDYYIAGCFYFIGVDKGYNNVAYLRIAFVFTVVGYIMIAAMPDRSESKQDEAYELPEI